MSNEIVVYLVPFWVYLVPSTWTDAPLALPKIIQLVEVFILYSIHKFFLAQLLPFILGRYSNLHTFVLGFKITLYSIVSM